MEKNLILLALVLSIVALCNAYDTNNKLYYFYSEKVLANTTGLINPTQYKQVADAMSHAADSSVALGALSNGLLIGLAFLPGPWATASTLGFSYLWNFLFSQPEYYLNDNEFSIRLESLLGDMGGKIAIALQENEKREARIWATSTYEAIINAGNSFKDIETVYMNIKKNNGLGGVLNPLLQIDNIDTVQIYMLVQHGVYKSLLETSLTYMANQDKVIYYLQVYIQTLSIYSSFIKDSIFYGEEWGLPILLVYGSNVHNIISYKENLHNRIMHLIDIYIDKRESISNDQHQRDYVDSLLSSLFYSDMILYPFYHGWIEVGFNDRYILPAPKKSIFTIDPRIADAGSGDPNYPYESPVFGTSIPYDYVKGYAKPNIVRNLVFENPTGGLLGTTVTAYTLTVRVWFGQVEQYTGEFSEPPKLYVGFDEFTAESEIGTRFGAEPRLALDVPFQTTQIPFLSKLKYQSSFTKTYTKVGISAPVRVTKRFLKIGVYVDASKTINDELYEVENQVLAIDLIINDDTGKLVTATTIPA